MERDDRLVPIGRVGRPHGLDGAFVVEEASGDEQRWEVGATVLVDGEPAEVVASRRVGGGKRAVRLDRPVSRGAELALHRSSLAEPEAGSYYVFELVGLGVALEDGTLVGTVRDVHTGVANDNLELDDGRLIPMIEDAIVSIDVGGGMIVVAPGFVI